MSGRRQAEGWWIAFRSTSQALRARIDAMFRRRVPLIALFAVLVLVGIAGLTPWPAARTTAISRENAAKLREGLTVAEVEAILGGPPRDDSTGPLAGDNRDGTASTIWFWPQPLVTRPPPRAWISDCVAVHVQFDDAGRALSVSCVPLFRMEEGPLATLRRWLHL
jgi:hypothetical protein